jgi:predicted small secreted protein
MKVRWICWLAVAGIAVTGFLVGCNTAEGFGKDLHKLGESIENKASEQKSAD